MLLRRIDLRQISVEFKTPLSVGDEAKLDAAQAGGQLDVDVMLPFFKVRDHAERRTSSVV